MERPSMFLEWQINTVKMDILLNVICRLNSNDIHRKRKINPNIDMETEKILKSQSDPGKRVPP
jgi:hypothetical protein